MKKAAAIAMAVAVLLLGIGSRGRAQGAGTGSIGGTVKDPKGLVVPGAAVLPPKCKSPTWNRQPLKRGRKSAEPLDPTAGLDRAGCPVRPGPRTSRVRTKGV